MSTRSLGEHVGRSFRLGLPAPSIGPVASLATVRRTHKTRASLNSQPTSTTRHDLRRVRVVQHHDRRARQVGAGVGQEVGGWLGHFFFVGPRGAGRRVRGRGGTLSGLRALLMFAAAWRVRKSALILCQTLCRLRGRCTRPARALPFGTPWGGARGLVGGHGRLPSRCRTGGLFFVGRPPETRLPALFVRSAPTTRYKESSWVPWRG